MFAKLDEREREIFLLELPYVASDWGLYEEAYYEILLMKSGDWRI